ncbi:MAG: hypothetical protein K6U03_05320 [Firmicutes bacterium]|nr:hypothetical protein [Bacillota bacterium]
MQNTWAISLMKTPVGRGFVEIIELPGPPFLVATQFYLEFKSGPQGPGPLFRDFVAEALRVENRMQNLVA